MTEPMTDERLKELVDDCFYIPRDGTTTRILRSDKHFQIDAYKEIRRLRERVKELSDTIQASEAWKCPKCPELRERVKEAERMFKVADDANTWLQERVKELEKEKEKFRKAHNELYTKYWGEHAELLGLRGPGGGMVNVLKDSNEQLQKHIKELEELLQESRKRVEELESWPEPGTIIQCDSVKTANAIALLDSMNRKLRERVKELEIMATKEQVEQLLELMRLVIDTPMEEYATDEFRYALEVLRRLAGTESEEIDERRIPPPTKAKSY